MARPKLRWEEADFWLLSDQPPNELASRFGRDILTRVLRSDAEPSSEAKESLAKLFVPPPYKVSELPGFVARLPRLSYLDIPAKLLQGSAFAQVAPSLVQLIIYGEANLATFDLSALEILECSDGVEFEVGSVPRLRELNCEFTNRRDWIAKLKQLAGLQNLCLSKLRESTLTDLACLRLATLGIHHSTLQSLSGLELHQTLRELSIIRMTRLSDVRQIDQLASLESLAIWYCPELKELGWLKMHKQLRSIELVDVPDEAVESLAGDPRVKA